MLDLFYQLMNRGYRFVLGNRYMLHAPLFHTAEESLFDAQCHFSDYCLSFAPAVPNLRVLDIGCGNGMMTRHLFSTCHPSSIKGVDVVAYQIAVANRDLAPADRTQISFMVDDAQELSTVKDNSIDLAVCIESALHYADKDRFLMQVKRVLAPGGHFLIADLLNPELHSGKFKKLLHLHNWTHEQYTGAFLKYDLELTADKNLDSILLPHLRAMLSHVAKDIQLKRKSLSSLLVPLAKPVINGYVNQLTRSFRYHLFAGRKR